VAKAVSLTNHIHTEPTLKSVELYLHSTCLPPWYILVQPNFTFTSYLCTYLSTGHTLSGLIKQPSLHITHPLHAHYKTHLFHLHWSSYINIMNSSNNETHYIIFCALLLLTPSIGQIFPLSFFPSQFLKTHYTFNVTSHISYPQKLK
jgi:hypothetical protein